MPDFHMYRRSSSRFFWLQIFTDSCKQIYALAGGHTHEGYHYAILCRFFSFTLVGPFWISYNNHYRWRSPIHVSPLDRNVPIFGFEIMSHNSFPSGCKRIKRAIQLQSQSCIEMQSPPDLWYRNLSLVLLGLRSAIKEDMGCATVEMALGTSIRLPGEHFKNSTPVELSEENTVQPTSQYAKTLCSFTNSLRYTVPRHPKKQQTYVDPLLFRCSQVFVRIDSVKSP